MTPDLKRDQLPRWMLLAPFGVAGFGLIAGVSSSRVARDFVVTGVIVAAVSMFLARRSARTAEGTRSPGFGPMADSPNELQRWAATSAPGYFVMWLVLGVFLAIVCIGLLALRGAEISYPKTLIIAIVGALGSATGGFVVSSMGSGYATRGSKQVKYLRPFFPRRRSG